MSYIVMVKRGETSLGFSRGSGCEAVATALSLIRNGEVDVSITSPRGVTYRTEIRKEEACSDRRHFQKEDSEIEAEMLTGRASSPSIEN
jgi:hypothetical protein